MLRRFDRICFFSKYEQVKPHKHYSKQLIISNKRFTVFIDDKKIQTRSILIQSNIMHEVQYEDNIMFILMVDESSTLSDVMDQNYLEEEKYKNDLFKIEEDLMPYILQYDLNGIDQMIDTLFLSGMNEKREMNGCIERAIAYVSGIQTIDDTVYMKMVERSGYSQSRFSHLFKEIMKMDCRNYLLYKKFEKAFEYMMKNHMNITEAAIMAGFYSSSHMATAFKNHFGLSISEFMEAQKLRVNKAS